MVAATFEGDENQIGPANAFLGTFLDDVFATVPVLNFPLSLGETVRTDIEMDRELDAAHQRQHRAARHLDHLRFLLLLIASGHALDR